MLKLGHMKGLVMKVGQLASYLPGALPDEAQRVLSELQAQHGDGLRVRGRGDRGRARGVAGPLFDDFERAPFAASIGQVHRAKVDGRAVAVKVQYPGVSEPRIDPVVVDAGRHRGTPIRSRQRDPANEPARVLQCP